MKEIKKMIHCYHKWGSFMLRSFIENFLYGEKEISEEKATAVLDQWKRERAALEDLSSLPETVLNNLSSLSEEEKWVFLFIWKTQNVKTVWTSGGVWGFEDDHGKSQGYTYEKAWRHFYEEKEDILKKCITKTHYLTPIVKTLISFLEGKTEVQELNSIIRRRYEERKRFEEEERRRKEKEHEEEIKRIEERAKRDREILVNQAKERGMPESLIEIFELYLENSKEVDVWELNKILDNYPEGDLIERFLQAKNEIAENIENILLAEKERKLLDEASKRLSPEVYKIFEGFIQKRLTDKSVWETVIPIIRKYSGGSTLEKFVTAEEELKKEIENIKFKEGQNDY